MKPDYIDDGREATRHQDEDPGNRVPEFELNPEFDDELGINILQIAKENCLREEAERVQREDEELQRVLNPEDVDPIFDIVVGNYAAAENILTWHRFGFVPYGDNETVRWLQNLLHGFGSRAPIMGSDGRYHDPHTSFRLAYLMPALDGDDYAAGGAPVVQQAEHPQAQVGRFLGVQEEIADLVEDGDPKKRMYGFDCDNLPPFVNLAGQEYPNTYPVVCIENIPHTVTYPDIVTFMERGLMPSRKGVDRNYPIHIFMERTTGKSQDAWIELPDYACRDHVMRNWERAINARKPHKLGDRVVDLVAVTQGEFMAAVFPYAKGIHWDPETGIPVMLKLADVDPYGTAFNGFLGVEELFMVRMFITNPLRAPFPKKIIPRCYHSMITTLVKYPWFSPYFMVAERNDIFRTYELMLESLVNQIATPYMHLPGDRSGLISKDLCTNFVNVGLRCPGFSERQKYRISEIMADIGQPIPISPLSKFWPCQTLSMPPEVNDADLDRWLEVFDKGATWTQLYPAIYGDSVGDIVGLTKDSLDVWWMEDLATAAVDAGMSGAEGVTFADLANAEQILMSAVIARGWKRFFADRQVDTDRTLTAPQPEKTVIKTKMQHLGVYKAGGASLANGPRPWDNIVWVAPKNRGTWRHLITSNTSEIPVRSLTDSMSYLGIRASAADEGAHQRIQAQIRGEIPLSDAGSDFEDDDEALVRHAPSQSRGRSTYQLVPAQIPPSTQGRSYSNVVSSLPQERTPQGRPSATVLASRAAGTYSVPQRRRQSMASPDSSGQIDFGSIARRAIATRSTHNTPLRVSNTAAYDPFGPSPSNRRQATPERTGRNSQPGSSQNRRRSQSPAKHDPFQPSPTQSPKVSTERRGRAFQAISSFVRRRSQSPAKYDPFGPSPAGASTDSAGARMGRSHEPTPATVRRRSQSPAKLDSRAASPAEETPTRLGRLRDSVSSLARRRRSKSPSKTTVDLTIRPPAWGGLPQVTDHGPIGTPLRRGTVSNNAMGPVSGTPDRRDTIKASPVATSTTPTRRSTVTNTGVAPSTLPDGETVEDWPTPGRASRSGTRSRR